MPIYNKLVRDLIPEIIENDGKSCSTTILNDVQYTKALQEKLKEEVVEVIHSETKEQTLEELADILEILHAYSEHIGFSPDQLERVRERKEKKRGRFSKRILLVEVQDDEH